MVTASNYPTVKLDNTNFPGSIKNEKVANLSIKNKDGKMLKSISI